MRYLDGGLMRHLVLIVTLLFFAAAISHLYCERLSREVWRLHNYSTEYYSSGPGGPSELNTSYHYIYNSQNPQLIDSVHVHSNSWGGEEIDATIDYNGSITYLDDRYIIQQSHLASSVTILDVIVKDNNDRFLSYATYYGMNLYYRSDWTYDNYGKLSEVVHYRNPQYWGDWYSGYWRYLPEYDIYNRKISETRLNSSDSLTWNLKFRLVYNYSQNTLPDSFLVKEKEPYWNFRSFIFFDVVNAYQIDSLSVYQYADSLWNWVGRLVYTYYISDTSITVGFQDVSLQDDIWLTMPQFGSYMDSVTYYPNGLIKYYNWYCDLDILHPSDTDFYYVWIDENTHVLDESIPSAGLKLSISPNPFSSSMKISNNNKTSMDEISIYNIKGQLVRTWKDVKSSELTWDGKDASNLSVSSGVYLIKAKQGNHITTVKTIKY